MKRTFPHPLSAGSQRPGPPSYAAFACVALLERLPGAGGQGRASWPSSWARTTCPDLLAVSFSATDLIYHHYGPYSWEMQDALVRLDRPLGELLAAAEKAAGGRQNLLVVLCARTTAARHSRGADRRRAARPRG